MSTFNMTAGSRFGTGRFLNKKNLMIAIGAIALLAFFASSAHAGAGGSEFEDVWMTLKDWSQGTLGRIIAGSMILVGLVGGIVRQSLLALALGIGGGLGVYNAPNIIESLVSATLAHAPAVQSTAQLVNGLM